MCSRYVATPILQLNIPIVIPESKSKERTSMPTKALHRLMPTSWLAQRLNISITTIERLRAQQSPDLPPHVTIGKSIRYDECVVEAWLQAKMGLSTPSLVDEPAAV
jgi:predicted DNA-binding transcriptional regulator AlpA